MNQIANIRKQNSNSLKLFKFFLKVLSQRNQIHLKAFIKEYYSLEQDLPDDFYESLLIHFNKKDYLSLFSAFKSRNIYNLISYLKKDNLNINMLEETLNPYQYYSIPNRHIKQIITSLKQLALENKESSLNKQVEDELLWLLKRNPICNEDELTKVAYKLYISIGLDNTLELLNKKYGEITYEQVHFMFSNFNTKEPLSNDNNQYFTNFLFGNKKDNQNIMRRILYGKLPTLFLNFDYLYNHFPYFIDKLGVKLPQDKLNALLKERYLYHNIESPEITGDLLDDMVSSYQCRFEALDTSEEEIHQKNYKIYNQYLKNKCKASIPRILIKTEDGLVCEVLK